MYTFHYDCLWWRYVYSLKVGLGTYGTVRSRTCFCADKLFGVIWERRGLRQIPELVTGIICQPEKDLGICHQTNALISVSAKAVIKTRSKSFSPGSGLCHTLPDFRSRSRCLVHPDIGLISDPVVGWPSITLSTCSSAGAWSVEWWQCSCNPVQLCK